MGSWAERTHGKTVAGGPSEVAGSGVGKAAAGGQGSSWWTG